LLLNSCLIAFKRMISGCGEFVLSEHREFLGVFVPLLSVLYLWNTDVFHREHF